MPISPPGPPSFGGFYTPPAPKPDYSGYTVRIGVYQGQTIAQILAGRGGRQGLVDLAGWLDRNPAVDPERAAWQDRHPWGTAAEYEPPAVTLRGVLAAVLGDEA